MVAGGHDAAGLGTVTVNVFHPDRNEWTRLADLPEALGEGAVGARCAHRARPARVTVVWKTRRCARVRSLGDGRLLFTSANGGGDAAIYDVRTDSWGTLAGAGVGRAGAALAAAPVVF